MKSLNTVEGIVGRVEQGVGTVVYIGENRVESTTGSPGVEAFIGKGTGEKIGGNYPAALITGERSGDGQQPPAVPVDHRLEIFNHNKGAHGRAFQDRRCGVAEAETSHHNVEPIVRRMLLLCSGSCSAGVLDPKAPEGRLRDGEQGSHEEIIRQLYLVDLHLQSDIATAA